MATAESLQALDPWQDRQPFAGLAFSSLITSAGHPQCVYIDIPGIPLSADTLIGSMVSFVLLAQAQPMH